MRDFAGKIAVVTGGGSGIGRELVRQLAGKGASVAMCDVSPAGMAETVALCAADGVAARLMTHCTDVSDETQVVHFQQEVAKQLGTDIVHLLINNAGIGGGGSLFIDSRASWDRTFNVCWSGVYFMTRAFLPMIVRSDAAHIMNVSSACGFWASRGPTTANTAYSASKFAVKGFTEALITDLKINAPHVGCSVAMPGRIGTDIAINSRMVLAHRDSTAPNQTEIERKRERMRERGHDPRLLEDDDIRAIFAQDALDRRTRAPMGPAEAAKIMLDGIAEKRWRIMVGKDAEQLDARVRADPEAAYDDDFEGPFGSAD